jgi:2-C-methyl-D-erythritol 4-phosphate cytidylyltransferase
MSSVYGIILSGGSGSRLGNEMPKQFIDLGGKPLIAWSLLRFNSHPSIHGIIVVSANENINEINKICQHFNISKLLKVIPGGKTRQESSYNAVSSYNYKDDDILLIHDAARPFLTDRIISDSISSATEYGAAAVYVKSIDTITEIKNGFVVSIPNREDLFFAQTPQSFRYDIIHASHENAVNSGSSGSSDDVSLVLNSGYKIKKVDGEYFNLKITVTSDIDLAIKILEKNKFLLFK